MIALIELGIYLFFFHLSSASFRDGLWMFFLFLVFSWNTLFHCWLDASAFGIGYTISESNKFGSITLPPTTLS